jgi:SAM-dependent methyltransferase
VEQKIGSMFGPGTPYSDYTGPQLNRLNERYKRIVTMNIGHIAGKRVLDLAAHDGRWSWAALKSGASYVEGVEGRPELVAFANKALSAFPSEAFRFSQGDIFDYLEKLKQTEVNRLDTILCLGIIYHINEHFRLLQLMAALKPGAIILDGALVCSDEPKITFKPEATASKLNAIPGETQSDYALVGTMSRGLLNQWCRLNGWSLTYIPWRREDIADAAGLRDYLVATERPRARFTCVLTPASADEYRLAQDEIAGKLERRRKAGGAPRRDEPPNR